MLDIVVTKLRSAQSLVVLTGAGVSAESGISTFRDALSGLWSRFRAEDLATPEAFERDPEMVSHWYDQRRCMCAACIPNAGLYALAELERTFTGSNRDFLLLTQNVDRLHQQAGSQRLLELHGSLWLWRCVDCGREREERGGRLGSIPRGVNAGGCGGRAWCGLGRC